MWTATRTSVHMSRSSLRLLASSWACIPSLNNWTDKLILYILTAPCDSQMNNFRVHVVFSAESRRQNSQISPLFFFFLLLFHYLIKSQTSTHSFDSLFQICSCMRKMCFVNLNEMSLWLFLKGIWILLQSQRGKQSEGECL